ncbi:MAG: hypothetical protein IMZ69_08440 [Spirochaetes bacterium]|nr:hypothetical protein [Spirochaetota bacterium]
MKPQGPRYPKPKILLVDMPSVCSETLRRAGYNVSVGSFGTPYRVEPSSGLAFVSLDSVTLPNFEEQEIIIIDTQAPDPVDGSPGAPPAAGVEGLWQSCKAGVIDPRPRAMMLVRDAFDNIRSHGGVFVVFASAEQQVEYPSGHRTIYGSLEEHGLTKATNWAFLSDLRLLWVAPAHGREVEFDSGAGDLARLLRQGAEGIGYECTIQPYPAYEKNWLSLARNKYGKDVAGLLVHDDPRRIVLVLPRMPAANQILVGLLERWFAEWNAALFPHLEGGRWVHRPEYEIPQVTELRRQIEETKRQAEDRTRGLEAEIKKTREANSDWYVLLRGTGADLVQSVIRALHRVGFQQVVDVDKEAREQGEDSMLREDIRVHDQSPVLVIDVKGVRGCPDDDETRQAEKHATMRMREWDSTHVHSLTIVNHQRHLPPHDRDAKAYRQEIVDNARHTGLGLMTTWDLFRLLRNKEALGWPDAVVLPIFYRSGRIEPVPEHYQKIGEIVRVWQPAIELVPTAAIHVGARLAIEVGDTFREIEISSLQVEKKPVTVAPPEGKCSVGYEDASQTFRAGMRVFLVVENGL